MRIAVLLILLTLMPLAYTADYAVVVANNSSITALEADNIRDIFLRKRNFEAGIRLVPVNLLGDEETRRDFEQKILRMDREEISQYWVNNHFQGISPPATQASLLSIKLFVERVGGAIGYLPIEMIDSQLKVLYEF